MSGKERIWAVVSGIWIVVVTVGAANQAQVESFRDHMYYFNLGSFSSVSLLFGVLPVLIGWGIWWIKKSEK